MQCGLPSLEPYIEVMGSGGGVGGDGVIRFSRYVERMGNMIVGL